MTQATHEAFSRDEPVVAGSDRAFGLVMAAAFAILTALNGWHDGRIWPWTGGVAALFLAAALLRPALLRPLNRLWLKFGLLLHKIVNPIVMGCCSSARSCRPAWSCGCWARTCCG